MMHGNATRVRMLCGAKSSYLLTVESDCGKEAPQVPLFTKQKR